jgi:hypothetical protein
MFKLMAIQQPNYQIAAAAEIHPTTLSMYARGTKPISAKHLVQLTRLFECDAEELLGTMEVEIA